MTSDNNTTIRIPYRAETVDGMFAVAQFASKDDVTAVIENVKVTPSAFVATDRYTVGRFEFDQGTGEEGDAVTVNGTEPDTYPQGQEPAVFVPRRAAEWLAKQTPKALGLNPSQYPFHAVAFHSDRVMILNRDTGDVLAVTRFEPVGGNYPPVEKLFPGTDGPPPWIAEGNPVLSLNPWLVERFVKAAKKLVVKGGTFTWTLQGTENPNKPGPVVVSIGERFTGLIQPNLRAK